MVDAIGGRTTNGAKPIARVADVQPTGAAATPARTASDTAPATLGGVAREMAAAPPVDADRVARIKRAIADGRFPISPSTIADQMIALRMNWISKDLRA